MNILDCIPDPRTDDTYKTERVKELKAFLDSGAKYAQLEKFQSGAVQNECNKYRTALRSIDGWKEFGFLQFHTRKDGVYVELTDKW